MAEKLEVQFTLSSDPIRTDLANQVIDLSPQPQAEYLPLSFLPLGQTSIPDDIKWAQLQHEGEKPVTCISKRFPLVYFGIGETFYAWDYKKSANAAGGQN